MKPWKQWLHLMTFFDQMLRVSPLGIDHTSLAMNKSRLLVLVVLVHKFHSTPWCITMKVIHLEKRGQNIYFGFEWRNNNTLKKIYKKSPVLASFETIDSGLKVGSSHYEIKVERIRSIKDKWCWSSFCSTPKRGTRSCGHTSREIKTELPMYTKAKQCPSFIKMQILNKIVVY